MSFFVKNKNKSTLDSRRKDKTDDLAGPDYNNETAGVTRGLVLDLFHVPTGESVNFKAFLTTYSDQYNSSWESTEVFGRMDPIQTFKNTKRVISLGWDVVASSVEEAIINLDKCQRLFSMLYPVYETHESEVPGSTTMVASPLFKLKFVNLIQNVTPGASKAESDATKEFKKTIGDENSLNNADLAFYIESKEIKEAEITNLVLNGATLEDETVKNLERDVEKLLGIISRIRSRPNMQRARIIESRGSNFTSIGNSAAKFQGLVGTVSGFTYEPDIDVGFFSDGTGGELYPQTIKLACEYTVLHTHELGWDKKTKQKRTNAFPYKANTNK